MVYWEFVDLWVTELVAKSLRRSISSRLSSVEWSFTLNRRTIGFALSSGGRMGVKFAAVRAGVLAGRVDDDVILSVLGC